MASLYVLLAILTVVSVLLIAKDWKYGLVVCLILGFLQDPIRKLLPGEPVLMTIAVGGFLLLTVLSALANTTSINPLRIYEWKTRLSAPFVAFFLYLIVQCLHTWIRYDNFILAGVGFMSYMIPVLTMVLAYQATIQKPEYIAKLLGYYAVASVIVAVTVYLEYIGVEWPILGEVGQGIIIYDLGTAFRGMTGLMRSPDITAWHMATAISFLTIVAVSKGSWRQRLLWSMVLVVLIGAAILTGRRKAIIQVLVFLSVYWILLISFARGSEKLAALVIFAAIVSHMFWIQSAEQRSDSTFFQLYVERGKTVFGEVDDRFKLLGIDSVRWAYNRVGFFGAGAGVAAQGARHFTKQTFNVGGSAEGGLGRVSAELGVPGLLIVFWLALVMFRFMWRTLRKMSNEPIAGKLAYGFAGFAIANFAVFIVATQVFGDLFVLMLLGLVAGLFFALNQQCSLVAGINKLQRQGLTLQRSEA